jgi:copper transport protein
MLAASTWTGGLVALLLVVRAHERAGLLTRRFSRVALGAVGLVVASGAVSGYLQVRTLDGLVDTGYGRLLLAKMAGVAALVALGWLNRRRLVVLADRAAALLPVVRAEVAVAVLVVALTAGLVDRVPARETTVSGPFSTTAMAGERGVQLDVEPARAGPNDVHLYFVDAGGLPAAVDAAEMTVARADVPARRVPLEPVTVSHFSAYGVSLPTAGQWRLEITWVREGAAESVAVEVPVR